MFIRQKGNGATHTATIELDGTYGTDLTLKQFNSTASYTLQQNCFDSRWVFCYNNTTMTKWYSVIPVIILFAVLKVSQIDIVKSLQYAYYDQLQQSHEVISIDDIVLVNIDEEAINKEGQYPWPRKTIAKYINQSPTQFSASINNDMVRTRSVCRGQGTIRIDRPKTCNPIKRTYTPNYYE